MLSRSELRSARELYLNLTLREVRGKYRRTVLGNLWSLLNPLAAMVIYTAVFSVLLRVQPDPGEPSGLDVFALWLMTGLLAWNFLSAGVSQGMSALVGNAGLLTKVYFPRWVLIASTVSAAGVTYAIELVALSAVLLVFGAFVLPWLPGVVVVGLLLAVTAFGLGLALSVLNVYFRDTQHFVAIGLQVWFYLTPIVYPISLVQEAERRLADDRGIDVPLQRLYELNPMTHFVSALRALMYDNRLPDAVDLVWCLGAAVVSLTVGVLVFRRFSARVVEEL
ncbi:MAG: ABC transporter permease [Kineosporiaceae bacterium]